MSDSSPDRIRFEILSPRDVPARFVRGAPPGCFGLITPLHAGWTRLERAGSVLYEGEARPGMLRLEAPGDDVCITWRSPPKALRVSVPVHEYERFLTELDGGRRRRAREPMQPILRPSPHVNALVHAVLATDALHVDQRQPFLDGLAHSLLAVLLEAQARGADAAPSPGGSGLTGAQYGRCREYAEARLADGLDLRAWAASLGMATSEFSRRFHAASGKSPYAWFLNRRIERAQELLLAGEAPVVDVALDLGFCSQSHFTKAFRQRVGLSPARWQAAHATRRAGLAAS